MVKWSAVFDELREALEEARKKRRYKNTTRLKLKILLSNNKAFLYKTTLEAVESVLWKLSSEHKGAIVKFAVESSHGHTIFFRSLYHTKKGQGAAGDKISLEIFRRLSSDAKEIRGKLLLAQIKDRLLWLDKQEDKS
jgi:hypothetical protein